MHQYYKLKGEIDRNEHLTSLIELDWTNEVTGEMIFLKLTLTQPIHVEWAEQKHLECSQVFEVNQEHQKKNTYQYTYWCHAGN